MPTRKIDNLLKDLGEDGALVITHRSFDPKNNYENLEFFGDSLLKSFLIKIFYELRSGGRPSDLHNSVNYLSRNVVLSKIAQNLCLHLKLRAKGKHSVGQDPKIEADMFEALIAAIYLNKGEDFLIEWMKEIFNDEIIKMAEDEDSQLTLAFKVKIKAKFKKLKSFVRLKFTNKKNFWIGELSFAGQVFVGVGSSQKMVEKSLDTSLRRKFGPNLTKLEDSA